jgi:hypothetical protein
MKNKFPNHLFVIEVSAVETAAAATPSATRRIRAWTCLVYHEILSHEIRTIQFVNCLAGGRVVAHFNKPKPPASLRKFVQDDLCGTYFSERFK